MALTITDLDFDNIQNNFKNYLKSQDIFKDYNFEGSAISELIRLLSYNTFYNNFYINNIANEMFLDTATLRSSVVSRAKGLSYTPSSAMSSKAYVDLSSYIEKVDGEISPNSNSFITLNNYAKFTSSVQEKEYNFITTESHNLYYVSEGSDYWLYKKNNVPLSEGKVLNYAFKVQKEYDKYIIPNPGIDINSLIVRIYPSPESIGYTTYTKASNLVNINEFSEVYWLYEGDDEKYYLEFGNDEYGKKLDIGNVVYVEYIVCNGSSANGCKDFSVGNYSYSNTFLQETKSLEVNNSIEIVLNIYDKTEDFSIGSQVISANTLNTIGYVSYYSNNVLNLINVSNTFNVGDTIYEYDSASSSNGAVAIISSYRNVYAYSSGGSDIESIDSIKFYAPKFYTSQNRLVTKTDYEAIIKHEYPYVDSVVCWGGEELVPEQLGEVFVSVKPRSRETLTSSEKEYLMNNIIEPRKIMSVNVQVVDADYIYLYPSIDIKYRADLSSDMTEEKLEFVVSEAVNDYCYKNCGNFNNRFYYSKFVAMIDDSNEFIISNITDITMVKHFKPVILNSYNSSNPHTLYFNNEFNSLSTSSFSCNVGATTYSNCTFKINSSNNLILSIANSSGGYVVNKAGSIDYSNAVITISNTTITATTEQDSSNTNIIKFFAVPNEMDLTSERNQILKIYDSVIINSTPIR